MPAIGLGAVILHRSLLFVPGGRQEMLEKAARFPADVLCLDLEESVLPEEKADARELVQAAVSRLTAEGRTVHVRVNSIRSENTRDDLVAVVRPGLAGVILAKTESARDVRQVDVLLREQELANNIKPGTVELIVAIESAQALLRCEEISHASTRLVALMLGGEDFAFDMGVSRTRDGRELDHARSVIATCARAAGLVALDTPWANIEDIDGLVADAERAKAVGFVGKFVIHPSHLEPVQRVFSPSEEEIAIARRLIAAWDEAQAKGLGAVQLDGRMIDRPIAERARRLIEQAEAIATA
ncbi:MAG: CoA ester lyase [Chloroflexi bacterium]|nr:CoA ester lyase [Chloroflexota bacterium]